MTHENGLIIFETVEIQTHLDENEYGNKTADVTIAWVESVLLIVHSVTRLGDWLHFGQLFKACGNNFLARIFGQLL